MRMSEAQFRSAALENYGKYCKYNSWAYNERDYFDRMHAQMTFTTAYHVYTNVYRMGLDLILLGDSGIREQKQTILNFSLLSATRAAQEERGAKIAKQVERARKKISRHPPVQNPMLMRNANTWEWRDGPVSVFETGSVLSTVGWSPLLNDSLVLAGAERKLDFIYALTEKEMALFKQTSKGQDTAKDKWINYFVNNESALWNDGFPRVFLRELLGLQCFRYKAAFHDHQLSFYPRDPDSSYLPTLKKYCDWMVKSGYYSDGDLNKRRVLTNISEYLFDDKDALDPIY